MTRARLAKLAPHLDAAEVALPADALDHGRDIQIRYRNEKGNRTVREIAPQELCGVGELVVSPVVGGAGVRGGGDRGGRPGGCEGCLSRGRCDSSARQMHPRFTEHQASTVMIAQPFCHGRPRKCRRQRGGELQPDERAFVHLGRVQSGCSLRKAWSSASTVRSTAPAAR